MTLHRYLIDFRRWEQCFCNLKAMLLQSESNALTLWNDCTYNAGAMLHINVGTRRAALLEQVGQTKYVTLLDVAFPLYKRGTPRPYICRFSIFVDFDKKLAASMKRKGMKGALKRVSP